MFTFSSTTHDGENCDNTKRYQKDPLSLFSYHQHLPDALGAQEEDRPLGDAAFGLLKLLKMKAGLLTPVDIL